MKKLFSFSLLILLSGLFFSCTKNETTEPVFVKNTVFCTPLGDLEGNWVTDSVEVDLYREFVLDTGDNANVQILLYTLDAFCTDSLKDACLRYVTPVTPAFINGAKTSNFTFDRSILYFLGENQTIDDTSNANLKFVVDSLSDSLMNAHYWIHLNDTFSSRYELYFSRI